MTIRILSASQLSCFTLGLLTLFIAGCDEIDDMQKQAASRPVTNAFTPGLDEKVANPTKPANPPAAAPATNPTMPAPNPAPQPAPDPSSPTTMQPGHENDPNLKKAGAEGTGKQGQDYGGEALMAPITTPIREYFNARGIIVSDMIKHDVDIYHAINNRYPKDWEAFKKEILEPGNRELPELPQGSRYIYDPKTGELFVGSGGQQK